MNKTVKLFIGLAIAIIFIPIAFYIFKFHHYPITSNPSEWGTFGDYIGGLLNPIISLFTLLVTAFIAFELKKIEDRNSQKAIESSYIPQLVIQHDTVYLYSAIYDNITRPLEFSHEHREHTYLSDTKTYYKPFGLNVFNIGLGSTKKTKFTFEFDYESTAKLINDLNVEIPEDSKSKVQVTYKHGKFTDNLNIKGPNKDESIQFFERENQTEISHLLSVSVSEKPYYLLLPNSILDLYKIFYYSWWQMENRTFDKWFPPFYVIMNYTDIGDSPFTKKFKINLTFWGGSLQTSTHQLRVEEILP
jgi:hypothetical protein